MSKIICVSKNGQFKYEKHFSVVRYMNGHRHCMTCGKKILKKELQKFGDVSRE